MDNDASEWQARSAHTAVRASAFLSETLIVASLLLVTFTCYVNMLLNGFVYDDDLQVLQNPYIKSWHFLPQIFGTTVWSFLGQVGTTNYYRPLMTLSYLILWTLFGPVPFGFHLFSLILHSAVVVTVFYVGLRIFQDARVAFLAALLFALHPIHTEAVDWIACFPDLQAALFLLVTMWIFANPGSFSVKRLSLLCVAFSLALLSKEISFMFVPLAIAFEHAVRPDRHSTSQRRKFTRYLPLCLLGIAYLLFRVAFFGSVAPVLRHSNITWSQTIYSAFALISDYTKLLLWPAPLSAFHVFDVSLSLADPRVLSGLAVFAFYIVGLIALLRVAPASAFALLWLGLTLVPVLNARVMATNVLTERYLYVPSVGFSWFAAWCFVLLWDIAPRRAPYSRVVRAVLAVALTIIAVTSATHIILRNRDWVNDMTLYTRTLQIDPRANIIRSNLAGVYFKLGDLKRAESEWKAALDGKSYDVLAMNGLGILYTKLGRYTDAESMFQRAILVKPLWSDPHFDRALMLSKTGDDSGALVECQKAVKLAPFNPTARWVYGDELLALGQLSEAENQFRKSLEFGPSYEATRGLATVYSKTGRPDLEEQMLRRLLSQSPYDVDAHLQLAGLLEAAGQRDGAIKEYQAVLRSASNNISAKIALQRLEAR